MIMGLLAIWSGLLLFAILGDEGNRFLSISLIMSGLVAVGVYFWMMKTTGTRVYKRLKDYHEPFDMEIGHESIFMTIHNNTYEMPWFELKKALVVPDMILLYPTERMFYIFPRSSFKDQDYESFEAMVKEKLEVIC